MSDIEQQPVHTEEWRENVEGKPFDLGLLWQVLEQHKETMAEQEEAGKGMSSTWELVVVQGALLTLLILVSICWAMCCRRRCGRGDPASQLSVAEALRKVSANKRDLPPSYSKLDLRQAGMSVQDYLNPPPNYLDLGENLQYLDLEQGHNRLAKLSFCNEDGSVARVARLSVASCENCNTESAVVVPVRQDRLSLSSSASSSVSSASSSRRQSRASSRVSFSEEVECSNGSIRRLSSNSLASEYCACTFSILFVYQECTAVEKPVQELDQKH